MNKREEDQIQTAIRLPESLIARIDKLAERLSKPGLRLTRADVHRQAVFFGVENMETEAKGKKR